MDLALAAEMDDVNARFVAAHQGLEAELRRPAPNHATLSRQRIALARLARVRLRFLSDKIIPLLAAGPTAAHRNAARALEHRLTAIFAASTKHIGGWGSAQLTADWPGYVAETRAMIAQVEEFTAIERREVLPLLATLARAA